ncbi:MAG: hypothetical protein IMZ53_04115 [Thermoplasmata archaeon]|nr:hypothetical protein [Thermoplasmata archaeon]MBE3139752.1 hypothetical protein [Thermoplasmata archaeon]
MKNEKSMGEKNAEAKIMTVTEHIALGNLLKKLNNDLCEAMSGKTKKQNELYSKIYELNNKLKDKLDDLVFRDYREPTNQKLMNKYCEIYYGQHDFDESE